MSECPLDLVEALKIEIIASRLSTKGMKDIHYLNEQPGTRDGLGKWSSNILSTWRILLPSEDLPLPLPLPLPRVEALINMWCRVGLRID